MGISQAAVRCRLLAWTAQSPAMRAQPRKNVCRCDVCAESAAGRKLVSPATHYNHRVAQAQRRAAALALLPAEAAASAAAPRDPEAPAVVVPMIEPNDDKQIEEDCDAREDHDEPMAAADHEAADSDGQFCSAHKIIAMKFHGIS